MSTEKQTKINQLVSKIPASTVVLSSWLTKQGYSLDLQKRYRQSNWFKSIGTGAMIRTGDTIGYEGALYTLQRQAGMNIHVAGKTALSLIGKAHYLELSVKKVTVFGDAREKLPAWFTKYDWGVAIDFHASNFLPLNKGFVDIELKNFSIKISGAARAIMECLYLAPEKQDLMECYELMEGLNNLRPDIVQELLEGCSSLKVKRLFIYMAEKIGHTWFQYLDLNKVDLGHGKRSLVKNGVYVSKYQITVPKSLEQHNEPSL